MISQTTPAGIRPARRARSTAASVWPARMSTPPSRERNGKTCPGWTRSSGALSGSIATWIVRERSGAEMPVVTPSRASTDTVNAVPNGVSFRSVICRRPSASQRSEVRQRQIRPRPSFVMKLTASGVANCAAIVRSPSFSRSAASTTTTNLPWRMSSIASSIVAKAVFWSTSITSDRIRVHQALHVLGEHVGLEIDPVAGTNGTEGRRRQRVLNERNCKPALVQVGDRERDAVDGDRALLDEVAEEVPGRVEPDPPALAFEVDRPNGPHPVDVTLDVVTAERLAGAQRRLEVHLAAERLGARNGLPHDVEREAAVDRLDHRQADPVDGHGIADPCFEPALDDETASVEEGDTCTLADNSGEHASRLLRRKENGSLEGARSLRRRVVGYALVKPVPWCERYRRPIATAATSRRAMPNATAAPIPASFQSNPLEELTLAVFTATGPCAPPALGPGAPKLFSERTVVLPPAMLW